MVETRPYPTSIPFSCTKPCAYSITPGSISNMIYEQSALQCFCGWIKCLDKCALTAGFGHDGHRQQAHAVAHLDELPAQIAGQEITVPEADQPDLPCSHDGVGDGVNDGGIDLLEGAGNVVGA